MSDIWVKTASGTSNSAWKKAVNIFVKTISGTSSAAWKSVKGVWVFNTSWFKVWPLSGVFAITNPYVASSSASTSPISGAVRVGTTYWGKNGTWNPNGWTITSYSYRWIYYTNLSQSDTTITSQTAFATYSAPVSNTISATYDKTFLSFYVRANASNSTYNGAAESGNDGRLAVVRRPPINISKSLSSYNPVVGTQISFSSSWNTTDAYLPEAGRTTISWYRNSTNSVTGGTLVGYGSYSYTPVAADLGYYIYAVETTFNSGTDYDYGATTGVSVSEITSSTVANINYQAAGQQRRVNLPSNFTSGTTIYVSTNGYIGIGADPSGSIVLPSSGLYLAPLQGDQRQTALWTYADASNFYVRWQGARYNDSAQTIDYQAKFYWNSTAVDVYFVTNNLSSSNPASTTAVYNNGSETVNWSASTSQTSSLISTGIMTRNTSQDGVDDNRTAITAASLSAPTITASVSPTTGTAGSTTYFASSTTTGNPTPTVTYSWQYFSSSSFSWVQYTTGTQFSPPANINSLYPNYGWQMVATASNSQGNATSTVSITVNTPVSAPSGGSVFLSGGSTPGSVITASTSGWSGSPTSYDVYITTALSPNIPTSNSSRVASSNGASSTTYTITSSDAISPVNIFRAFATASNGGGTSGTVQSSNTISATPAATAPSVPGTPTLTYVPANNTASTWGYSATWGASTGTGTIQYQINAIGSSGGTATLGLYSTNSASFNLSRNDNTWQIQVRATNNGGSTWSNYSGFSNSA
ncbi:hypothetical protein EB001_17995 [bacterium]|nr:hypothetical protein [bacterium]